MSIKKINIIFFLIVWERKLNFLIYYIIAQVFKISSNLYHGCRYNGYDDDWVDIVVDIVVVVVYIKSVYLTPEPKMSEPFIRCAKFVGIYVLCICI